MVNNTFFFFHKDDTNTIAVLLSAVRSVSPAKRYNPHCVCFADKINWSQVKFVLVTGQLHKEKGKEANEFENSLIVTL